ncbi:MAG TPA: arylsulfatase [Candidatus Acidoferrum sp.]|nr:arylsulfatase [Candidatus Acidoferrum sp.]
MKRLFVLAIAYSVVLQIIAATPPVRAQNPPNIIFILADDLGYGDLGCYGQKRIKTPNLDKLAAEGMRFTQCYAGSTVCAPSRSCLMTGQHTGHTRVRGNNAYPLRPEDVTVATVLQNAGYKTGLIGKWGLGLQDTTGTPAKHGFSDFAGFLSQTHAHQYYPTSVWRFSARPDFPDKEFMWMLDGNTNDQKKVYVHDLFTRGATNFVTVHRQSPFFLYLAYTAPHANNELGKASGNGMEVPSDAPYSDEDWPQPEKNKAAMITRMDRDIGRLMEYLKAFQLDTNTAVFFTSDNGPHDEGGVKASFHNSSGPLRGIKRDMYEGGIRVPMIVRWPGQIKAGAVNDFLWALWDFLPTAAAISRSTNALPKNIDGMSVLPTLLGKEQKPHEFFYWEFHEKGSKQAVRMGDWKAVRLAIDKPLELYNLKVDLGETNNVAAAHPEIVARIEAYLKTARTPSEKWPLALAPRPGERVPAPPAAEVN